VPYRLIITLDGPAGAGKSSVAKRLAQRLGYTYLDSGAVYRALALLALRRGGNLEDAGWMAQFLVGLELEVDFQPEGLRLWHQGQEITAALRAPEVSQGASKVATLIPVRRWVGARLRHWVQHNGFIAEGRDLGTVVFPEAGTKLYLDGAEEVRARRRFLELQPTDASLTEAQVRADLASRDQRDRERLADPLRIPPGAAIIDTTGCSLDEVVDRCLEVILKIKENNP
jgi:CMP/dCMP kinase